MGGLMEEDEKAAAGSIAAKLKGWDDENERQQRVWEARKLIREEEERLKASRAIPPGFDPATIHIKIEQPLSYVIEPGEMPAGDFVKLVENAIARFPVPENVMVVVRDGEPGDLDFDYGSGDFTLIGYRPATLDEAIDAYWGEFRKGRSSFDKANGWFLDAVQTK